MKLPVIRAFGATYAFVIANFANLLRIAWLPFLLIAVAYGWELSIAQKVASMVVIAGPHSPSPDRQQVIALMRELAPIQRWNFVLGVGAFVLSCIVNVGVLKPILRGAWPRGSFYLGFGKDELRVIAAKFIVSVLLAAVVIGCVIAMAFAIGLSAAINKAFSGVVAVVALSAFAILIIWLLLRLSLVAPASLDAGEIGFERSWETTKGNVWHLLVFWILVWLPLGLLGWAVMTPLFISIAPDLVAQVEVIKQNPDVMPKLEALTVLWRALRVIIIAAALMAVLSRLIRFSAAGFAYRLMTANKTDSHKA